MCSMRSACCAPSVQTCSTRATSCRRRAYSSNTWRAATTIRPRCEARRPCLTPEIRNEHVLEYASETHRRPRRQQHLGELPGPGRPAGRNAGAERRGKNEEAEARAAPAAAAAQEQDPMDVHVTAEMAPNFAVKPVAQAQIALLQEVSGRIEANERQVTRIGAAATGRVTEGLVEVGDRVRAGQVLARVASPELDRKSVV